MPGPVLVLDLSSALYVGLVSGGLVLASRVRPQGTRGENAHALLDECLSEAGLAPADLTAICVGMGPGSFTGIRVCGAMAQGLAFAQRLPLHPFSSLAALETTLPPGPAPGVSAIAANAGRWYARARRNGAEALVGTDALLALAGSEGAGCALAVSGNLPEKERLTSAFASLFAFEDRIDFAHLADLALAGPIAKDGALRPNYLAASAAEDKLRAGLLGKPRYPRNISVTPTCVRPLIRADIPAVLAIEVQANPSPWRSGDFEGFTEAVAPAEGGLAPVGALAPGGERKSWVYADPEVRGFLCAMAVAGEAELQAIAVERARWSRGAGTALMEAMLLWARERGLEAIHLEVREGNRRAIEFYQRHGFAPVGRRPKYYQDNGEAAVLMKRAPI